MSRRALLSAAVVAAAVGAVAAPSAMAADPSPDVPPPDHPVKPPKAKPAAFGLTRARVSGRKVNLGVTCASSGHLRLTAPGRIPKRLGAARFTCVDGRAKVRLNARKGLLKRLRTGARVQATIKSGTRRTSLTLSAGQGDHRGGAARIASYEPVPAVWCTGVGFSLAVNNTARFGAAWGETVWWRPIGYETRTNGRAVGWNMNTPWTSHRAVPGDGNFLIHPNGTFEFTWTVAKSMPLVTRGYGIWVDPAIQVYTSRGGYESWYVAATAIQGYGEVSVDKCLTPVR